MIPPRIGQRVTWEYAGEQRTGTTLETVRLLLSGEPYVEWISRVNEDDMSEGTGIWYVSAMLSPLEQEAI